MSDEKSGASGALADLIARLERATGSDRDLNVALYAMLWNGYQIAEEIAERQWEAYRDFTGSIDAAVALVERVLPGCDWSVHGHKRDVPPHLHGWAGVRGLPQGAVSGVLHEANAHTPAIALHIALLRAYGAQEMEE